MKETWLKSQSQRHWHPLILKRCWKHQCKAVTTTPMNEGCVEGNSQEGIPSRRCSDCCEIEWYRVLDRTFWFLKYAPVLRAERGFRIHPRCQTGKNHGVLVGSGCHNELSETGQLNTSLYLLQFWRLRSSRSTYWPIQRLVRTGFLAHRQATFSLSAHMAEKREQALSSQGCLLIRALSPS